MGFQDFQPLRSPCSPPASSPEHQIHLKTEKNIRLIRKTEHKEHDTSQAPLKGGRKEPKRRRKAFSAPSSHFGGVLGPHVRDERTSGSASPSAFLSDEQDKAEPQEKPARSWASDAGSPHSHAGLWRSRYLCESLQGQAFDLVPREPAQLLGYSRGSFFSHPTQIFLTGLVPPAPVLTQMRDP